MTKATYYAVTATGQTSWYDRSGNQRYGMDWYIVAGPCAQYCSKKCNGKLNSIASSSAIYAQILLI
jgi:hypothetical protein